MASTQTPTLRPAAGFAVLDRREGRIIRSYHGAGALARAQGFAAVSSLTGYLSVVAVDEYGTPFGPENLR